MLAARVEPKNGPTEQKHTINTDRGFSSGSHTPPCSVWILTATHIYKDFEADNWFGLYVPAKTPRQNVTQLSGWFTAALEVPEVKAKLVGLGLFPVGMCGADFNTFVRKKYDEYGHAIRELNIKVN